MVWPFWCWCAVKLWYHTHILTVGRLQRVASHLRQGTRRSRIRWWSRVWSRGEAPVDGGRPEAKGPRQIKFQLASQWRATMFLPHLGVEHRWNLGEPDWVLAKIETNGYGQLIAHHCPTNQAIHGYTWPVLSGAPTYLRRLKGATRFFFFFFLSSTLFGYHWSPIQGDPNQGLGHFACWVASWLQNKNYGLTVVKVMNKQISGNESWGLGNIEYIMYLVKAWWHM